MAHGGGRLRLLQVEPPTILHRDRCLPRNGRGAVAAFLKVQVDLKAANTEGGRLAHFCNDPRVKQALGADFKVKMGFGLHVGWAIEGTIGSKFKIDASYLSPNVNVSARLEAATHMYDCPLLFSGFFADELSPAARSFCRMVDVVSVKVECPSGVWTADISTCLAVPQHPLPPYKMATRSQGRGLCYDITTDLSATFAGIYVAFQRRSSGLRCGDWLEEPE